MERKEWLKTFIWLADNNRPALEYRKRLGVAHAKLPVIIKKLPAFRKELAEILEKERLDVELKKMEKEHHERRMKEAYERDQAKLLGTTSKKSKGRKRTKSVSKSGSGEKETGTSSGDNSKTLGARADNSEE